MSCSRCASDLPAGSQFCLKCGEPVSGAKSTALATIPLPLNCANCGREIPEGAQRCPNCGRSAHKHEVPQVLVTEVEELPAQRKPASRFQLERRLTTLVALAVLAGIVIWAATSDNSSAVQFQEFVGWRHSQSIVENSFSVKSRDSQVFKFSLPENSTHADVLGEFKIVGSESNQNIQVYVLTEPAFINWQNGYGTGSLYDSGRVNAGKIEAQLPSGAGIYYLAFNNKFSAKEPKSVHAEVILRYKSWLPDWVRRLRDHFFGMFSS